MGDLSFTNPELTPTVLAIYDYWKKRGDSEPIRGYLGASIIGHECDRYLWYMFRGCVKREFEGRMYRLFNRGHREEAVFVEDLKAIGCEVHDVDENGNQFELSAIGGHFKAHMDGCALGVPEAPKTWHVLEFKTFGGELGDSKDFDKLKWDGLKKIKPMHYSQVMVEMALSKMERALYLAAKKSTDELFSERVRYVPAEGKAILARAERIIKSIQPCERCTNRSDDYRCKRCDASVLCWGSSKAALPIPRVTCRTCCHATPEMDGNGRWSCALGLDMKDDCKRHLVIPGLLAGCDPIDADEHSIKLKETDEGREFTHGNAEGQWTTAELMVTPLHLIADKGINLVKHLFGGMALEFSSNPLPLTDQYPHEDSRLIWHGRYNEAAVNSALKSVHATEKTRNEETTSCLATEYDGKYLLVIYKADNYAALWEGVE